MLGSIRTFTKDKEILSDEDFENLKHLLGNLKMRDTSKRIFLEACAWKIKTNKPWSELPMKYGDARENQNRYYKMKGKEKFIGVLTQKDARKNNR